MPQISAETKEIIERAVAAGQPMIGAKVALGTMSNDFAREMLGMPAKPGLAAGYAPSDDGHVLCPTCGGSGEIAAPDDADDQQQDTASQPAAAAMPGWARAFAAVHAGTPARG